MRDGGFRGLYDKHSDTTLQLGLSIALGISAFLGFCILRTRWESLYAARKRQTADASGLPELPKTFFGWIVPLWRVTDQQILACAGLDAYVFLRFLRMASTYLAITLFFALAVIKPVTDNFADRDPLPHHSQPPGNHSQILFDEPDQDTPPWGDTFATDHLWMYLVFAYFFTAVALYFIVTTTRAVIQIRQDHLGSQTSLTDRTFRLSGIPAELQSAARVKQAIEELQIGKVDSVTLCCDWKELDDAMDQRHAVLRRLEECLTVYHGYTHASTKSAATNDTRRYTDDDDPRDFVQQQSHVIPRPSTNSRPRPSSTIRFGRFNLQSRKVDAIDHYRQQLREMDDDIRRLRSADFKTMPMAFVTMESVASCQMAVQAVLDPSPQQMIANQSPDPAAIVWPNTYLSRRHRLIRAWTVTVVILILTFFWFGLFVPVATALNTDAIAKFSPQLADWLDAHDFTRSLVQTQLPTLILSLLTVAVPYVYEWLANRQGMTSQSDVELSVISKNFFFTFFNFFVVFTILGTASNFLSLLKDLNDSLRDTTRIAWTLAESLLKLQGLYVNFLILQALGLLPLRLLEIGAVVLYPIYRMGAKTPRDFAELTKPPVFSYGMYAPQVLLIFIICITYSVLEESWKILLAGCAYFVIGSFVYKYQLLYAMDHRQHSTGRSWIMMCNRFLVGLVFFQLTVGGQLAAKHAPIRGAMIVPLLFATVWFTYSYNRTYDPLMRYIALKSVRGAENAGANAYRDDNDIPEDLARWRTDSGRQSIADSSDEPAETSEPAFVNPNLVSKLEPVWLAFDDTTEHAVADDEDHENHEEDELV